MNALLVVFLLMVMFGYITSFVLGIILLVRIIRMGIACVRMGSHNPREQISFIDIRGAKLLWNWILGLSILFALSIFLYFNLSPFSVGGFRSVFLPSMSLSNQIAVLVAGKIIMGKYTRAEAAYRRWAREKALSALPEAGIES